MERIAVVKTINIGNLKEIKIKKYIYIVSFYLIAAVLLFSGVAKIIDPLPLIDILKLITFIPESLHVLIATLLPVIEIGLAVLIIMKIKPKATFSVVTIMFLLFLGISIYGTALGFGTDCGCFGKAVTSSFGWGMVGRNTMFFIISLYLIINAWPGKLNNK